MPKYHVTLKRQATVYLTVEVEHDTEEEARNAVYCNGYWDTEVDEEQVIHEEEVYEVKEAEV